MVDVVVVVSPDAVNTTTVPILLAPPRAANVTKVKMNINDAIVVVVRSSSLLACVEEETLYIYIF